MIAALLGAAIRAACLGALVALCLSVLRLRSAATRSSVWTVVLFVLLAMPCMQAIFPALPFRVPIGPVPILVESVSVDAPVAARAPEASGPRLEHSVETTASPAQALPALGPMALAIYFAGVVCLFVRAVAGLILARRLDRRATLLTGGAALQMLRACAAARPLAGVPRLAESPVRVPMTLGFIDPLVLLPEDWPEWTSEKLAVVLSHEIAHVARRDALVQRLALVYRLVFWFSPFSWWLARHLEDLAEQASDEAVLTGGADRTLYAETLLDFFAALDGEPRRAAWHVAMARRGSAERRVDRILNWKGGRSMKLTMPIVLGIALAAIPVAVIAASARPTPIHAERVMLTAPPAPLPFRQTPLSAVPIPMDREFQKPMFRTMVVRFPASNTIEVVPSISASAPPEAVNPSALVSFAGRWVPTEPERLQALFDVGMTTITRSGITITQDNQTITIVRLDWNGVFAARSAINSGCFPIVSTYYLNGPESRNTTSCANGQQNTGVWDGQQLVVSWTTPRIQVRVVYSIQDGQLRIDQSGLNYPVFFKKES